MSLLTNLTSYYKFDESSGNPADSVGSNTLTNNGTVTYVAAKINNGANLAIASSQFLSRASQSFNSTAGTISAWVKLTSQPSVAGYSFCIFSTSPNTGAEGVDFLMSSDATPVIRVYFGNAAGGVASHTTALTNGVWYHMVATWTTARKDIYLDGTLVGSNTNAQTQTAGSTTAYVGNQSAAPTRYADMVVDEMGIWSRAITAAEVTELYNGGSGISHPFTISSSQPALMMGAAF